MRSETLSLAAFGALLLASASVSAEVLASASASAEVPENAITLTPEHLK